MRVTLSGAVVALVALTLAACSNASTGGGRSSKQTSTTATDAPGTPNVASNGRFPPVDQPGVTPTEIRVSGVAAVTNPLGVKYASAFDGVQAYFDMVNSEGGIYGRKLVLANRHDDQLVANRREVEAILDQDHPFAVLPVATVLFTGADLLAKAGVPTFGWNIQDEWAGPPNFFGHTGALCLSVDCASAAWPSIAYRFHKTRVAVLAYSVAQSANCLDMVETSFKRYKSPAKVVFADKSLSFGVTDLSTDVKKMRDAKVDLVTTCMDANGMLTLAREMRQQGLNAQMFLANAYDPEFMARNAGFFEGAIVLVQEAPLETRPQFAALKSFVKWMDERGYAKNENSLIGWVNADEFVTGLRGAGPSFTRQKVVDALNQLTSYDAGGLIGPIDWTRQHTDKNYPLGCGAFLKVHDGKFVPVLGDPGKPFVCTRGVVTDVTRTSSFTRQ
ncbi:MAG TPA: ABC transporter substrate-binding protein [Acidimicrobiia bacterium]|nr:ABC transporter substrate-binding protein [Acidimicrobiia bacterium]